MPDFNPTQYAVPLFVGGPCWPRSSGPGCARREGLRNEGYLVSLTFGLGSTVASALLGGFALWLMLLVTITECFDFGPEWWAVWWHGRCAFVLDDLAYYWTHRAGPHPAGWWRATSTNHSSQHYNLSTALRQTWDGAFTFGSVRASLVLLGFHPVMIAICGGFNLIYQFWIHTEAIKRMPLGSRR